MRNRFIKAAVAMLLAANMVTGACAEEASVAPAATEAVSASTEETASAAEEAAEPADTAPAETAQPQETAPEETVPEPKAEETQEQTAAQPQNTGAEAATPETASEPAQQQKSEEADLPTSTVENGSQNIEHNNGKSNGQRAEAASEGDNAPEKQKTNASPSAPRRVSSQPVLRFTYEINSSENSFTFRVESTGGGPPANNFTNVTVTALDGNHRTTGLDGPCPWKVFCADYGYATQYRISVTPSFKRSFGGDNDTGTTRYPAQSTTYSPTALIHTAYFNGNGGSSPASIKRYAGQALGTLPGSSRTGYSFAGWYTAASGGSRISSGTTMPSSNVTYYAHWNANTAWLHYNGNGGTPTGNAGVAGNRNQVAYGSGSYWTGSSATRTGYTFDGYWTAASGGTQVFGANGNCTNGTGYWWNNQWVWTGRSGSTIELYAHWKLADYSLNINVIDGDGNEQWQTGSAGTFSLSYDNRNWKNNQFNEDGTRRTYQSKIYIKNIKPGTGLHFGSVRSTNLTQSGPDASGLYTFTQKAGDSNIDIRMTWNTYKVHFNANGGSGSMPDQTLTYSKAAALTGNAYTLKGYSFAGWSTSPNGQKVYGNGQSVTNLTAANGATVDLYALWSKDTYKITYDLNGGTNNPNNPSTFQVDTPAVTLQDPTRTGYTFTGWTGPNGQTPQKDVQIVPGTTGDKTYTANWSANTYHITYKANGGSGADVTQDVKYDTAWTTKDGNTFTKTGYTLTGWKAEDGTVYALNASQTAWKKTGDLVLNAVWTANGYTVKFNANTGTGNMADEAMVYDVEKALTISSFAKTGYLFTGWNTAADGSGTSYADGAKVMNLTTASGGVVTLYAQWKAITYKIRFDGNGATGGSMEDQVISYDQNTALTPNGYSWQGYTFKGWNTQKDGKGTAYADQHQVLNLSYVQDAVITLYAVWSENPFTVTIPTNISYRNMNVGRVNTSDSFDVKVDGDYPGTVTVKANGDTSLTSSGKGSIKASAASTKAALNFKADSVKKTTSQKDTITMKGEAKSINTVYTGQIQYIVTHKK